MPKRLSEEPRRPEMASFERSEASPWGREGYWSEERADHCGPIGQREVEQGAFAGLALGGLRPEASLVLLRHKSTAVLGRSGRRAAHKAEFPCAA